MVQASNPTLLKSIPGLQKSLSVNCPSSGILVHLTLQKTIAIFLKYSIQKSSLVDELAPQVFKDMNEHLFKLGQCFA